MNCEVYVTLPAAFLGALFKSKMPEFLESRGSTSNVAVPSRRSYAPTVPQVAPPTNGSLVAMLRPTRRASASVTPTVVVSATNEVTIEAVALNRKLLMSPPFFYEIEHLAKQTTETTGPLGGGNQNKAKIVESMNKHRRGERLLFFPQVSKYQSRKKN